jgi:hypothetical protein
MIFITLGTACYAQMSVPVIMQANLSDTTGNVRMVSELGRYDLRGAVQIESRFRARQSKVYV